MEKWLTESKKGREVELENRKKKLLESTSWTKRSRKRKRVKGQ